MVISASVITHLIHQPCRAGNQNNDDNDYHHYLAHDTIILSHGEFEWDVCRSIRQVDRRLLAYAKPIDGLSRLTHHIHIRRGAYDHILSGLISPIQAQDYHTIL